MIAPLISRPSQIWAYQALTAGTHKIDTAPIKFAGVLRHDPVAAAIEDLCPNGLAVFQYFPCARRRAETIVGTPEHQHRMLDFF